MPIAVNPLRTFRTHALPRLAGVRPTQLQFALVLGYGLDAYGAYERGPAEAVHPSMRLACDHIQRIGWPAAQGYADWQADPDGARERLDASIHATALSIAEACLVLGLDPSFVRRLRNGIHPIRAAVSMAADELAARFPSPVGLAALRERSFAYHRARRQASAAGPPHATASARADRPPVPPPSRSASSRSASRSATRSARPSSVPRARDAS